jgi:hypothetical protein
MLTQKRQEGGQSVRYLLKGLRWLSHHFAVVNLIHSRRK